MTRVRVRLPVGREAPDDFSDITAVPVVLMEWESGGVLCIEFAGNLTGSEARGVAIRCQSLTADEEQIHLDLDALNAGNLAVIDDPAASGRDKDVASMLSLMVALLTPGPSETT